MRKLTLFKRALIFLILTVFTQVGGVVYLLTIRLRRWAASLLTPVTPQTAASAPPRGRMLLATSVRALVFIITYLAVTLLVVPLLARPFGRVPMPITRQHHLQPNNIITCLLNRNYVRPQLRAIAM